MVLYFLPHQDDEYGVFHRIHTDVKNGERPVCIYCTDGGRYALRRNRESSTVLTSLGVLFNDIYFYGTEDGIRDGQLCRQFPALLARLQTWMADPRGEAIYAPAWEGGHPDHDGLHAAVVVLAHKYEILHKVRQFPLYNGHRRPGPFYRVLSPLEANGPAESAALPWARKYAYLRCCLSYQSQAKAWLGLFPFVLWHYLWVGREVAQPVNYERLMSPPHDRPLYYERRNYFSWLEMQTRITQLWSLVSDL